MPAALSCGTASGAGVSIRSTWPASSALVRVSASGIGTSTSLSTFGMRSLFQYSEFLLSSASSRGTSLVSLNGPVPDGWLANLSQSLPSFSYCAGLEIRNHSI